MSEWYDSQKHPSSNFRKSLLERIDEANPHNTLTVAFNPLQNNNPIAVRRRKLMAKIDEKIQLANDKGYTPTQHKWLTDDEGKQTKVEVTKRVKRWWTASVDDKINLVVCCGSKPLEFAKGKNAIELASEAEVADTLRKVREAAELSELDTLIERQAQFGRRVSLKNK